MDAQNGTDIVKLVLLGQVIAELFVGSAEAGNLAYFSRTMASTAMDTTTRTYISMPPRSKRFIMDISLPDLL